MAAERPVHRWFNGHVVASGEGAKRMKALIGIIELTASLSAAETPNLTGTWNMGLEADHVIPTAFVLKQDGKVLTGTIALPQRNGQRIEIQLSGSIADGAFSMSGTMDGAEPPKLDIIG